MNGYIGYIRVSTVKQGTKGVSLVEQRDAILRYAERNQLPIAQWLEETETAAKQGRPVFTQALTLLRQGKAKGIILHKLDRGARNLRDWAAIGELSDQGVEVHFVTESLDLKSRGGRLSADIQAVVAADFIRNLREETRKGIYGRLKQGLFPMRAPLGYLDQGKGKAKTIDPVAGPLVRKAFELYGTGRYNLDTLGSELHRLGLRNRNGHQVSRNGLSIMLNNPFHMGIIRIKKSNQSFAGIHEPLISKALFDRVRAILTGKVNARTLRHAFVFRRLLTCATCHYSLVGERQKGYVYYRCHGSHWPKTSIREEVIEAEVGQLTQRLRFDDQECAYFKAKLLEMRLTWADRVEEEKKSAELQLAQLNDRLNRLTDAYLDQALDKAMFEERKSALLMERKRVENALAELRGTNQAKLGRLEKFLEQAGAAWLSYQSAFPEERREMVRILTSNREVAAKSVALEPAIPFATVANRFQAAHGVPERDIPRTWDKILNTLTTLNTRGELPDLSPLFGCRKSDAGIANPPETP